MKTKVIIERGADGSYGLHTPDLKNVLIGNGATLEDAKRNLEACLQEMIQSYEGETLPEELKDVEFDYQA